jgi:hypothetical protein
VTATAPTLVCALCDRPLVYVAAPEGHEDHQHVRCDRCSAQMGMPPNWSACVHYTVTVGDQSSDGRDA